MASRPPPFPVEDNTDEAFFDELVNDDFDVDYKPTTTQASKDDSLIDGNESDDAKAFANLSIHDEGHKDEEHWEHQGQNWEAHWENQHPEDHQGNNDEFPWDNQHISDGENSRTEDLTSKLETVEHINQGETEFETGKDLSNKQPALESSGGSGIPEVKEVDWSAFGTSADHNDSNGFGSYSDFFSEFAGEKDGVALGNLAKNSSNQGHLYGSDGLDSTNWQYSGEHNNGFAPDQSTNTFGNDLSVTQQWESQYPGWKYDSNTGQWYSVDDYDAGTSVHAGFDSNLPAGAVADGQISDYVSDWDQGSQLNNAAEPAMAWNQVSPESNENSGVPSNWNQTSYDNNGYPSHMVFDPQYPDWYYDTIAMEWRSLESYYALNQSTVQEPGQIDQGSFESYSASALSNSQFQGHGSLDVLSYSVPSQSTTQVQGQMNHRGYDPNQAGLMSSYYEQHHSVLPAQAAGGSSLTQLYSGSIQNSNQYWQNSSVTTPTSKQSSVSKSSPVSFSGHTSQQDSANYGVKSLYQGNLSPDQNKFSMPSMMDAGGNLIQQFNDSEIKQKSPNEFSNDYYTSQRTGNFSTPHVQNAQIPYASASGRSSAGRPAHALVTFGFGGKLVVMKHVNSTVNMNFGSQDPVGGTISVLNLGEVLNGSIDTSDHGMGASSYFQALCRHSVPGPLTGGSVGTKELNKWIDERITNLGSTYVGYGKAEGFSLLLSLLKIACQYYGKLRSPYGTDAELKESDAPDLAIARLFASAKRDASQFSQYGAAAQCLQQMPSDRQLQVTAAEVQNLLVSGRKKEALQRAQEGQFWGLALVLAAQLGNQFYSDTVKNMALQHLSAGSPLRTLCLLIANQPADVFSEYYTGFSNVPGAPNMPQQTAQSGTNGMLDDWEENLAVITANRTKDDELVLIHLGDCLWKERSNIIAAHICYLVAEANFEPYSDSARLCLVGADHLKFPRTFASPEAIQRTEIYEYSKSLGNSQFVLLPFQPYKFVYALMLAEMGKMSEAAKYCQAVLKSLKTGRNPELEALRHLVSSLDERIKAHQQGGFYANLAPKEFIGKLLKVFDSTAHRVVGGLPPSVPTTGGTLHGSKDHHPSPGHRVSASQSTMAMSSLVPSQSMEPISEFDNNRTVKHARSASEPDFGRSPMQTRSDSLKQENSSGGQDKSSAAGAASGFGGMGLGSKLFQKTFGFVLKNRRQAKLGETNKFYYDEKLKRWVEEGAEPPAEEPALPPPPTTAAFQNGASDYNLKSALQNEASLSSRGSQEFKPPSAPDNNPGIPPLPPTTNQYSARGRMGVRSRYVDTFNKGGGGNATTTFQSPVVPSIKPATSANPKFFVPAPVSSSTVENPVDTPVNNPWENASSPENNFSSSTQNETYNKPMGPPPSIPMQRYPSMNSIERKNIGTISAQGRRTASWSGSFDQAFNPPPSHTAEAKSLGNALGFQAPNELSTESLSARDGSAGEDLHEVEL